MKSFYEMVILLKKNMVVESHVIGEDDDDPFRGEIEISGSFREEDWEIEGSFFAVNYVPNGSEPAIGRPVYHPHEKYPGTEFMNPGKRLENLPEPLRGEAIKWVEREFERIIEGEWKRYSRWHEPFKPY